MPVLPRSSPLLALRTLAALLLAASLALPLAAQQPPTFPIPGLQQDPGKETPPSAEAAAEDSADARPTREQIAERLDEIEAELAALRRQSPPTGAAAAATMASTRLDQLEKLERLLEQQADELRRAEELAATLTAEQEQAALAPAARLEHPPPYRVRELDAVLDELDATRDGKGLLEEAAEAASRAVDKAREQLAELESRRRRAREALAADGDAATRQELAELEDGVAIAREQLVHRRLQLDNSRRDLEVYAVRAERLAGTAGWVREQLQVERTELEEIAAELAARTSELAAALAESQRQAEAAERRWQDAQQRLDDSAEPPLALVAEVDARRLELETAERRQIVLGNQAERLEQLRQGWDLRFRLLREEVPAAELRSVENDVSRQLADLEREMRVEEARREQLRRDLELVLEQLAAPGLPSGAAPWVREQRSALLSQLELSRQDRRQLEQAVQLFTRLGDELDERVAHIAFGERLRVLGQRIAGVWEYEITSADDQPITVGKVVLALLLILFGYAVSRYLSGRLGRSLFPRMGLESGVAAAYQTLIFYTLMVIFFFYGLRVVNIPLTIFTVVGGMLAIGIGFGSQNIVNNFISGLIILAERPIKVGDLVDVDGIYGVVERIGLRSAWIRSGDNTHVIVPNSAFLERNVLNWTKSDDVIRTSVDVGVAYGSPTAQVARLLEEAMAELPAILESPPHEVLFADFGDSSLVFRAYFWVRVQRPLDLIRVQSALRFRVDELFRQHQIVISFPQRDVHLDTLSPLEVRVLRSEEEKA